MCEDTKHMANTPEMIVTLFVFFLALGLCFLRWPQADSWHVALCLFAAGLWTMLLLFVPDTWTPGFGLTAFFLVVGLARPLQIRARSRSSVTDDA